MQRLLLGDTNVSNMFILDGKYVDVAWPVFTSSIDIEYLVVGAGGAGGRGASGGQTFAGGGGAGAVNTGSFEFFSAEDAPDPFTVYVVPGIPGLSPTLAGKTGGLGGWSYVGFNLWQALGAAGSGGGGRTKTYTGGPTGGNSGVYQQDNVSTTPLTGSFESYRLGGYNSTYDYAAGGGAGASVIGGSGNEYTPAGGGTAGIGGAGGAGVFINDWYLNSFLDVVGTIAGGGGGSAYTGLADIAGIGADGGGAGAVGSDNAGNATSFGSGGGGSYLGDSGDGAGGLVILRYQNQFALNNVGDEVFQIGDTWYHVFTTPKPSNAGFIFTRPAKILVSV